MPPTTPAAKPTVVVSAQKRLAVPAAKRGIKVAVAAAGGTTLTVTLSKNGKVVDTETLPATGGVAKLKTGKKKLRGGYDVVATVNGAGGSATDSTTVKVK